MQDFTYRLMKMFPCPFHILPTTIIQLLKMKECLISFLFYALMNALTIHLNSFALNVLVIDACSDDDQNPSTRSYKLEHKIAQEFVGWLKGYGDGSWKEENSRPDQNDSKESPRKQKETPVCCIIFPHSLSQRIRGKVPLPPILPPLPPTNKEQIPGLFSPFSLSLFRINLL